jgi:hypothetical protein
MIGHRVVTGDRQLVSTYHSSCNVTYRRACRRGTVPERPSAASMHAGLSPNTQGSGVWPSLFSDEQFHSISTCGGLPGCVSRLVS